MTDRYEMSREFSLAAFESRIMKVEDVYELQVTCIKLFAQTIQQRKVYETLLRDVQQLHQM